MKSAARRWRADLRQDLRLDLRLSACNARPTGPNSHPPSGVRIRVRTRKPLPSPLRRNDVWPAAGSLAEWALACGPSQSDGRPLAALGSGPSRQAPRTVCGPRTAPSSPSGRGASEPETASERVNQPASGLVGGPFGAQWRARLARLIDCWASFWRARASGRASGRVCGRMQSAGAQVPRSAAAPHLPPPR